MANVLPLDKQVAIISALTEGCSIRAVERLTGVHRDTIMRLGVRVGTGCAVLHDDLFRDLHVARVELDEAWSFIVKKRDHVTKDDPAWFGDQYVFIALDATSKAILSYRVGKRNSANTHAFVADLRGRLLSAPEISSDAWRAYPGAVEQEFGWQVDYGTIDKNYKMLPGTTKEAARRYSPGDVVSVVRKRVLGMPRQISTSYVERQNLTLRMQQRRFTRLTNAHSKKLENHVAAVSLYVAHYNFCRIHEALRVTPAMHLGITDHVWTIRELVEAALDGNLQIPPSAPTPVLPPRPPKGRPVLRVIDGGRA